MTMSFTVNEDADRVTFTDTRTGKEICGAFRPEGHDYWCLYVTQSVAALTGCVTPPHREHFHKDHGRHTARAWALMIASLYDLATQQESLLREQVAG